MALVKKFQEKLKTLNWINYNTEFKLIIYDLLGESDKFNTPIRDETLNLAKRADAILGAVGGPNGKIFHSK